MQPTTATMSADDLRVLSALLTRYHRHVVLCEPQDRALVTAHLVGRLQDRLAGSIARRGGCRERAVERGPAPRPFAVPAAPCSPDRRGLASGRVRGLRPATNETSEGTARVSSGLRPTTHETSEGTARVSSGAEGRRQSLTDDATRCAVAARAAGGGL